MSNIKCNGSTINRLSEAEERICEPQDTFLEISHSDKNIRTKKVFEINRISSKDQTTKSHVIGILKGMEK